MNSSLSRFRRILPQVLATTIRNLHVCENGLIMAIPVIIIPSLTGIPNDANRNELLSITPDQATWIGEIEIVRFHRFNFQITAFFNKSFLKGSVANF